MDVLKRIEKITRGFGTKEKETGLRFNPGLVLISLPTTEPWGRKANNWAQKKLASEASPAREREWVAEALLPMSPLNPNFNR